MVFRAGQLGPDQHVLVQRVGPDADLWRRRGRPDQRRAALGAEVARDAWGGSVDGEGGRGGGRNGELGGFEADPVLHEAAGPFAALGALAGVGLALASGRVW